MHDPGPALANGAKLSASWLTTNYRCGSPLLLARLLTLCAFPVLTLAAGLVLAFLVLLPGLAGSFAGLTGGAALAVLPAVGACLALPSPLIGHGLLLSHT
jgi:hypothetical protein